MIRKIRLHIELWLIALGLAACAPRPCSVRSAAAFDSACAATVVETLEAFCPDAAIEDCPEAALVLASCDAAIEAHAERCEK